MLYVTLVLSVGLLLVANLMVFSAKKWEHPALFPFLVVALAALGCLGVVLIAAVATGVVLTLVLVPWMFGWAKPRTFVPVSLAAFAAVWGGVSCWVWNEQAEFHRLREKYPVVSLESRLPPRPEAAEETDPRPMSSRAYGLQLLHERTKQLFVNSPGFGVARIQIREVMAIDKMTQFEKNEAVVPQAEPTSSASLAATDALAKDPHTGDVGPLHKRSLELFLDPDAFGYVRSRRETIGFVGHRFAKSPADSTGEVRSIDLIGLLLHPEPVAYVSANLPRMDELREAETRPLTPFEAAAIERLRRGEDLVAARAGDRIRAVGAIRNGGVCKRCHDGSASDLLGAFSYVLASRGE